MNIKTEITKIHYDKNSKSSILLCLLDFMSIFYGVASSFKNFLYDNNILKSKRVEAYVISVGNLTTGGVGKTPVVSEIAKYLIDKGYRSAIVSRGYGGQLSNKNINVISNGDKIFFDAKLAGDEPFWLAENTKGAVVITCKNRFKAAEFAVNNFKADYIILDDGFQHRKLHRDFDIVLADSKMLFGNEKLLPAGPLREGFEAFKRINKFIIVSKGTNHQRAEKLAGIMQKKNKIPAQICRIEPDIVYNIKTKEQLSKETTATAVCAIGQPEQFYGFLSEYNIKEKVSFDDHHLYNEKDLPQGTIITTEKDAVKMMNFERNDIYALKLKTTIDIETLLNDL